MTPLLEGIRVLELSTVVMGPYAGQILADLGAQVTKIETLEGDVARSAAPRVNGMSALHVNNNRNKRAMAIDLKSTVGKDVLQRLVARSDVLLHNMRPEAAQRLGVGFAATAAVNPGIIYCSAIGFGQRGRYRARPAFDDVIQAAAGLAGLAQRSGEDPRFIPTNLADKVGALHAVYGILAALVARSRGHHEAVHVEVPMFEATVSFLLNEHLAGATFEAGGKPGSPRVFSRNRHPFRTRDGWMAVLPYTAEQWRRFLTEAGRTDLLAQPWFATSEGQNTHIDELYGAIATALPQRDTATWMAALSKVDVPCSQISSLEDLLSDPHLADTGFFEVSAGYPEAIKRMLPQPVVFQGFAERADNAPRALGADTRAVLSECGYSDAEIDQMARERKIVATQDPEG